MTPVPSPVPAALAHRDLPAPGSSRLDGWLTRCGLRDAAARDRALAVALAVLTAAGLTLLTGPLAADLDVRLTPARRVLFVVLSVAQALVLALRRTRTPACLLLMTGVQAVLTATVASEATVRGVPVVLAFFTAGAWLPLGRLLRWGGLAVALEVAATPLADLVLRSVLPPGPGTAASAGPGPVTWVVGAASVVVVYGAAAAVGVTVATRRRNVALLEARAVALEQERAAETRRAVEAERLRMARELHDVAAHHLTGLVVQAAAAERLVPEGDEAVRQAVREVRRQGRQALDSLRGVVGVLRQDGTSDLVPVPGLAVLGDLVDGARALGDRVTLTTTGTSYVLPPAPDVTAYRVAQEALSNARQHAPGRPVHVEVAYGPTAVELTVTNELAAHRPAGARTGFGLAGMRERAALVGATLEAGSVAAGSWRVLLVLPRPAAGTASSDGAEVVG